MRVLLGRFSGKPIHFLVPIWQVLTSSTIVPFKSRLQFFLGLRRFSGKMGHWKRVTGKNKNGATSHYKSGFWIFFVCGVRAGLYQFSRFRFSCMSIRSAPKIVWTPWTPIFFPLNQKLFSFLLSETKEDSLPSCSKPLT